MSDEEAAKIAEELKTQGNEAFKQNNFTEAIKYYSEAIGNLISHNIFRTE
jgi:hypothetical protein